MIYYEETDMYTNWLRSRQYYNKPKTTGELIPEQMRNDMPMTEYKLRTDVRVKFSCWRNPTAVTVGGYTLDESDLKELLRVLNGHAVHYFKDTEKDKIQKEIAGAQLKLTNAQKKLRDLEVR